MPSDRGAGATVVIEQDRHPNPKMAGDVASVESFLFVTHQSAGRA